MQSEEKPTSLSRHQLVQNVRRTTSQEKTKKAQQPSMVAHGDHYHTYDKRKDSSDSLEHQHGHEHHGHIHDERIACTAELMLQQRNMYQPTKLYDIFQQKADEVEKKLFRELKAVYSLQTKRENQRFLAHTQRLDKLRERESRHMQRERERTRRDYEEIIMALVQKLQYDSDMPSLSMSNFNLSQEIQKGGEHCVKKILGLLRLDPLTEDDGKRSNSQPILNIRSHEEPDERQSPKRGSGPTVKLEQRLTSIEDQESHSIKSPEANKAQNPESSDLFMRTVAINPNNQTQEKIDSQRRNTHNLTSQLSINREIERTRDEIQDKLFDFVNKKDDQNSSIFMDRKQDLEMTMNAIKASLRPELLYILEHLCCDFLKEVVFTSRNMLLENKQNLRKFKAKMLKKIQIKEEMQAQFRKIAKVENDDKASGSSKQKQSTEEYLEVNDFLMKLQKNQLNEIQMSSVVLKNFHKNQELELVNRDQNNELDQKALEDLLSDKKREKRKKLSSKSGILSDIDILSETDSEDQSSNEGTLGKTPQEKVLVQARKFLKLSDTEIIEQMRREIREHREENRQLKQKIESLYLTNNQMNEERKKAIHALNDARMQYTKELLRKQDQITMSKKYEDFEYVQTNFLDFTKSFDEPIKQAWAYHHKLLEDQFNNILHRTQMKMDEQRDKIFTFQRLCDSGNVFIKLSDMNAHFIVKKLFLVEDDANKVWTALRDIYGQHYFKDAIERDMGITPDYKEKLEQSYKSKLKETTQENQIKLTQIEKALKEEVKLLRDQYQEQLLIQVQTSERFNKEFNSKVDEAKDVIRKETEKLYQTSISNLNEEINYLKEKYNQLVVGSQDLKESSQSFNLQYAMLKWRFSSKLRQMADKLKSINTYSLNEELVIQLNRELVSISDKFFNPRKYFSIGMTKQELVAENMRETDEIRESMADIRMQNQEIKLMANEYIQKYCYADLMVTQQSSQLEVLGMQTVNLSADLRNNAVAFQLMQESSDYKDQCIANYEKNWADLQTKLSKLISRYPALAVLEKGDVQNAEELSQKLNITFAKHGRQVVANILQENHREKFCQTDIAGMHLQVESYNLHEKNIQDVKDIDEGVQCQVLVQDMKVGTPHQTFESQEMQTDLKNSELRTFMAKILKVQKNFLSMEKEFQQQMQRDAQNKNYKVNHKENFEMLMQLIKELLYDLQNIEFMKQAIAQEGLGMTEKPMGFSSAQSKLKRVLAQGLLSKVKKHAFDKSDKKKENKNSKSAAKREISNKDLNLLKVDKASAKQDDKNPSEHDHLQDHKAFTSAQKSANLSSKGSDTKEKRIRTQDADNDLDSIPAQGSVSVFSKHKSIRASFHPTVDDKDVPYQASKRRRDSKLSKSSQSQVTESRYNSSKNIYRKNPSIHSLLDQNEEELFSRDYKQNAKSATTYEKREPINIQTTIKKGLDKIVDVVSVEQNDEQDEKESSSAAPKNHKDILLQQINEDFNFIKDNDAKYDNQNVQSPNLLSIPDQKGKSRTNNQIQLSASMQEMLFEQQNQILTSQRSHGTNLTTLYRRDTHPNDINMKKLFNTSLKKPDDGGTPDNGSGEVRDHKIPTFNTSLDKKMSIDQIILGEQYEQEQKKGSNKQTVLIKDNSGENSSQPGQLQKQIIQSFGQAAEQAANQYQSQSYTEQPIKEEKEIDLQQKLSQLLELQAQTQLQAAAGHSNETFQSTSQSLEFLNPDLKAKLLTQSQMDQKQAPTQLAAGTQMQRTPSAEGLHPVDVQSTDGSMAERNKIQWNTYQPANNYHDHQGQPYQAGVQQPRPIVNTYSSHLAILEKILIDKKSLQPKKEQGTQTEFDGVFIGKLNGQVEMGRSQTTRLRHDREKSPSLSEANHKFKKSIWSKAQKPKKRIESASSLAKSVTRLRSLSGIRGKSNRNSVEEANKIIEDPYSNIFQFKKSQVVMRTAKDDQNKNQNTMIAKWSSRSSRDSSQINNNKQQATPDTIPSSLQRTTIAPNTGIMGEDNSKNESKSYQKMEASISPSQTSKQFSPTSRVKQLQNQIQSIEMQIEETNDLCSKSLLQELQTQKSQAIRREWNQKLQSISNRRKLLKLNEMVHGHEILSKKDFQILKRPESQHQPGRGRRNRALLQRQYTKISAMDEGKSTTQFSSVNDINQQMSQSQFIKTRESLKMPSQSKQSGQPSQQQMNQSILLAGLEAQNSRSRQPKLQRPTSKYKQKHQFEKQYRTHKVLQNRPKPSNVLRKNLLKNVDKDSIYENVQSSQANPVGQLIHLLSHGKQMVNMSNNQQHSLLHFVTNPPVINNYQTIFNSSTQNLMSNPSQYTDHRIPVDTTPSIEILNTQPVNEKSFNNLEGANLHRQKMTSSKSSPRILVGPSQAKQLPLTSGTYNTNLHSKPAATFVHSFGIVDSGRDGTVKVIGGDNSLVESRNLDSQDIKENLNKESKSKY